MPQRLKIDQMKMNKITNAVSERVELIGWDEYGRCWAMFYQSDWGELTEFETWSRSPSMDFPENDMELEDG